MRLVCLALVSLSLWLSGCASTANKTEATSEERSAPSDPSLSILITRSHLAAAFVNFSEVVRAGLTDMRAQGLFDEEKADRLEAALERHFVPEQIQARAEAHLGERFSSEEVAEIRAHLEDPAIVRINQMIIAANQALGEELQAFIRSLEDIPPPEPPERRHDLCERMVRNVVSVRTARALVAVPLDAMLSLASAARADGSLPEEEREAAVAAAVDGAIPPDMTDEDLVLATLFAVHGVSDDDVERYVAFFETKLGRRYAGTFFEGFVRGFEEATSLTLREMQAEG